MYKFEIAGIDNIDSVTKFHMTNFKNYYLTNLGENVVYLYYKYFIENSNNVLFVCKDNDTVIGIALFVYDFESQISMFYRKYKWKIGSEILKKTLLLNKVIIDGTFERLPIENNKKRKQTEFLLPKLTLLSLAIDLKYRGKGIGTELLMFSENNLLDNNIDNSYYLSVLKSNVNGINFYKKMNFKMLGENNSLCYMLKDIYRRKDCE